jgi:Delta24(24(1))-sterol reductase
MTSTFQPSPKEGTLRKRSTNIKLSPNLSTSKNASPSSSSSSSSYSRIKNDNKRTTQDIGTNIDKQCESKVLYEFGGPVGVSLIMLLSPLLMSYFYFCLKLKQGQLQNPFSKDFWMNGMTTIIPNQRAMFIYLGFNLFQLFTAAIMPGIKVLGLPVPSLGGKRLEYLCNGLATWYIDLIIVSILHQLGWFSITSIVDEIGPIMSVAILTGIVVTIVTYTIGCTTGNTHRMSGSFLYDLFMGAMLNPRIGNVDMKMWSEIRIPWKILFFISLSAAVKDHELNVARDLLNGTDQENWSIFGGLLKFHTCRTSAPLLFMTHAHFLYVNACMKGEECIPTTWDMFYEKWGFMLIFWNFAGVPFSYCYSTLYLLNRSMAGNPVRHSKVYNTSLFVILVLAYYVWDTSNSQKNRFRMQQRGTFVKRNAFPQLPWGTITNPTYIETKHGNKLLTGGWWGLARKINYTSDIIMALSWGFITGFDSFIPYFYAFFLSAVLIHRVGRDNRRCKAKYGADFDEYCRQVPYIFVPYII